jgi:uncharacterized protein YigA (DUF484 family)
MVNKKDNLEVDATKVSKYLCENPNFLIENPELLGVLSAPSKWGNGSGGNIADLQTSMLDRMRNETTDLKDAANLLMATTRSNIMVQTRTHAAVIAILAAKNLASLIHVVCFDLPHLLDIDAASLCLETGEAGLTKFGKTDICWVNPGIVDKVLGGVDQFTKLIEHTNDDGRIFGVESGIVMSAALSRLQLSGNISSGILALGSRTKGAFHSGQGTDLLLFFTRVLELSLQRWLD